MIEGDSFAILQDFETLEGDKIAHDFAQVIEVGDIILFKNFSNVLRSKHVDPNGNPLWYKKTCETFVLKRCNSDKLWVVHSRRKKFQALITEIVNDFPTDSVYKDIENVSYEMIPDLIREYNRLKITKYP